MTIIGEAVAAAISANWQVGTGGTKPSIIGYLTGYTERDPNPTDADAIFVYLPLPGKFDRVNDTYRNETYDIRIVCETSTSSARQVIIENEVDRIFAIDGVLTGVSTYFITEKNDISDRQYGVAGPKYKSELSLRVITYMASGATAYGSATVSSLTTDTLTVNTSADIADPTLRGIETEVLSASDVEHKIVFRKATTDATHIEWALSHRSDNQDFYLYSYNGTDYKNWMTVDYGTPETILKVNGTNSLRLTTTDAKITSSEYSLAEALMLGSANAAWVPCSYFGVVADNFSWLNDAYMSNTDDTDTIIHFKLHMPTVKGTLKLYVAGTQVILADADATDYITATYVSGVNTDGSISVIDTDNTNKDTATTHEDTFTGVDCSSYKQVVVRLSAVLTTATDLDIVGVNVKCYYA